MAVPLLNLLKVQSFILDHYGTTSKGKTFGDQVAMSMLGNPKTLLMTGSSSESHIEMQITLASDLPTCIDETSLADTNVLTSVASMIKSLKSYIE
jgi:uncharacterized protein (DUF927 family)